jgi:branched-chain amino acid transport system ATP-binding protein
VLEIAGLKVSYGDIPVLFGVDLSVREGEIVALIGSNGMGKTTLIKTISGVVRACQGKILFKNEPINLLTPGQIVSKGISQVPEGRKLFMGMSIRENLFMGAYTVDDAAKVMEDLNRVYEFFPRLKERERQIAGTLSGGEQQMCAIGRALMSRPQLLVIDEMSLGLAPVLVDELITVVREINQEGMSILLVEQDVQVALENSNRGYVIQNGIVTLSGDSAGLLNNPEIRKSYMGI